MIIGIIGTRGIPNNYGGFEQFAEYLSTGLVRRGYEVFVYNPHNHPFLKKKYEGVNIIHKYDPEFKLGTLGQFIYDLNCILDSRRRGFDIILQLGYTSNSIWGFLFPKKSLVLTNMDGLEWKRSKYNFIVRQFLKFAERLATKTSSYLIADSLGIQSYLKKKYNIPSFYIPYGADTFSHPDIDVLDQYRLKSNNYDMLIARLEPENNIETILSGVISSKSEKYFLVIGNHQNKYGSYLKGKFRDEKIIFLGPIYNLSILNNLRYYSDVYYHGHTVGGTNPSLLEAMSSHALICAHDNEFNKSILGEHAYYFSNSADITNNRATINKNSHENKGKIEANLDKINKIYSWNKIISQYEEVFKECYSSKQKS